VDAMANAAANSSPLLSVAILDTSMMRHGAPSSWPVLAAPYWLRLHCSHPCDHRTGEVLGVL